MIGGSPDCELRRIEWRTGGVSDEGVGQVEAVWTRGAH